MFCHYCCNLHSFLVSFLRENDSTKELKDVEKTKAKIYVKNHKCGGEIFNGYSIPLINLSLSFIKISR